MKLTGSQLQTLQSALLSAYGSPAPLAQMVRTELEQNLHAIAGGENLSEIVFSLITWAERTGNLPQLVEGATAANPGNIPLRNWSETNQVLLSNLYTTGETVMADANKPWWEQLPNVSNSIAGLDLSEVKGSVIVANVGPGSRNVAIGENITQIVTETLGEPQADDRARIEAQMAQLVERVNLAALEPRTAGKAEARLEDLETELTRQDEKPDASQIIRIGDWLLENVPEISHALGELFGIPAVGRVLAKAGGAAVEWARKTFES